MNDLSKNINLIKESKLFSNSWYRANFPDVEESGLSGLNHYLRYGAAMGRSPSRHFDAKFYETTYMADPEASELPLLHYLTSGKAAGHLASQTVRKPKALITEVRQKLFTFGFVNEGLTELQHYLTAGESDELRALAASELAFWELRTQEPEGVQTALDYIQIALSLTKDNGLIRKMHFLSLMCHHLRKDMDAAKAVYDEIGLTGGMQPDVMLAWVNFKDTPEQRVAVMNRALSCYDIPPMALLPDDGRHAYDRLTSAQPLTPVFGGPKVTVLLAAYEAAEMIGTALRSLQEQTWQNLEIIVLDDYSPSLDTYNVASEFAAKDPRIKVIRMPRNAGAYIARNRGLDEATGDYVTIHDADDWSHPMKIEVQVRFMENHPTVMGCTSEQARCRNDLSFGKIRSGMKFITQNTSAFLWRRQPVCEALGYWDTVRFGADNEFIRRMQIKFGKNSLANIKTGPLSFQRESESSITTDPIKGIDGVGYYGVRKEYYEGQLYHHATSENLKYTNDPENRPFFTPPMMNLPGREGYDRHFDVVIYADARDASPELLELTTMIETLSAQGTSIGLVEHNYPSDASLMMSAQIRKLIAEGKVQTAVYGEEVACKRTIKLGTGVPTRYQPTIRTL